MYRQHRQLKKVGYELVHGWRIKNTSQVPTEEMLPLIHFAMIRWAPRSKTVIEIRHSNRGPGIWGTAWGYSGHIRLIIGRPDARHAFPFANRRTRIAPVILKRDWYDSFVYTAAHEARHIWQARNRSNPLAYSRDNEVDAAFGGKERLEKFRKLRGDTITQEYQVSIREHCIDGEEWMVGTLVSNLKAQLKDDWDDPAFGLPMPVILDQLREKLPK